MPDTFVKIASVTVGSGGAATMSFTSIPQTYTDLCVMVSARSNYATTQVALYPSTNLSTYSEKILYGDGSSATSGSYSAWALYGTVPAATSTSNTFCNTTLYFPNYAGSAYKSLSGDAVGENNATGAYAQLMAGLVSSTGAITSITLATDSNFVQYSTATLYGIKNS